MVTSKEEDYLKAIFKLSRDSKEGVETNSIGEQLDLKAPSVSVMLKKLAEKELVTYVKYKGVSLTEKGRKIALSIVRKHRLWETFLVEHLKFRWDEVHDIAEQLEHVQSPELVNRLDEFLGFPGFDPHGDPIPDEHGRINARFTSTLNSLEEGAECVLKGVKDHSPELLQYLESIGLTLGAKIRVLRRFGYDNSMTVELNGDGQVNLSFQINRNLIIG